jgi:hypothetical protein
LFFARQGAKESRIYHGGTEKNVGWTFLSVRVLK